MTTLVAPARVDERRADEDDDLDDDFEDEFGDDDEDDEDDEDEDDNSEDPETWQVANATAFTLKTVGASLDFRS